MSNNPDIEKATLAIVPESLRQLDQRLSQRFSSQLSAPDLLPSVDVDLRALSLLTVGEPSVSPSREISASSITGTLHRLIDSTGIKVEGEGEWNARKHGDPKRRAWRKVHLGIDEEALETKTVEVTSSDVGDAPMLPELFSQLPPDHKIVSVTADGPYDTRKCHDAIAERGSDAIIPPCKNAKPWKTATAGAVARSEALRASKYLAHALWRRWSGYHRRSRAETKMHFVKVLGQRLMARDCDRQVAEFQVRVAVLNGFTTLGIPVTKS